MVLIMSVEVSMSGPSAQVVL